VPNNRQSKIRLRGLSGAQCWSPSSCRCSYGLFCSPQRCTRPRFAVPISVTRRARHLATDALSGVGDPQWPDEVRTVQENHRRPSRDNSRAGSQKLTGFRRAPLIESAVAVSMGALYSSACEFDGAFTTRNPQPMSALPPYPHQFILQRPILTRLAVLKQLTGPRLKRPTLVSCRPHCCPLEVSSRPSPPFRRQAALWARSPFWAFRRPSLRS